MGLLLLIAGPLHTDESHSGEQLYKSKGCYLCHGYEGQGGSTGPRLAPGPLPLVAFAIFVRKPPNVMPAYSPRVLSDEELEAIYRFVGSIQAPSD